VSRWPFAGPSEYWLLASSPASKVKKKQCPHSTTNTHTSKIETHTRQLQQYTRSTNNNYTKENLKLATKHTRKVRILHVQKVKTSKQESTVYSFLSFFLQSLIHSLFHPSLSLLITYYSKNLFHKDSSPPPLYCTSLHLIPLHFASLISLHFVALRYTPR